MAPKVWVTAHSREEGPAAFVGNQQVKAKAGSHIAPHLRAWRLCWKMGGWGWAELKVSLGYIARLSEMKENIG